MSAPMSTRRQSAGAPTPADAPTTANGLLLRAVRRRRHLVVPGLVLMTLWQLCEALVPIAIGVIVDVAIIPLDRWALLWSVVGLIALFTVLSLGYRFGARMSNRALQEEAHDLRVEVTRVPLTRRRAMDGARSGDVLSVCSADADVAALVFRQIALGGSAVISIVGISVYLLWADWLVGLIVLIGVPLSLVLVALPSRAISRHSTAQQAAIGRASSRATDIMAGLRVLKAGGGERWAAEQYRTASEEAAAAGIVTAERTGRVQGIGSLGMAVVLALVLLAAGYRVLAGEMEIGTLVSVVGVAVFFEEPVRMITQMVSISARSHGAAQRLVDLLGSAPVDDSGDEVPAGARLEVRGLALPDGRPLDLEVAEGEVVALVADQPAAANAVTLAIAGHGDGADAVLVGGHRRSHLAPAIAEHLVAAPHRVDLFVGTIRSNIAMRHGGSEAAVPISDQVLRASAVAEIIEHLPDGLDHAVQEGGRNLSGGQRQRIALARALHADPDVLVLHEPTSAVDAVTEWEIAQAVRRLRTSRPRQATLIVTSSPPFLATADRVVHLPRSGEARSGTHLELREASASYRTAVDR
ncbi:putative ABC transport system ATP-binding protein [Dietzia kunjamensis subsp. schimae]|uniref:ABC transport system ATP-binding protein n=1 Tax=Dietzia kunjamensis subsp. schimae TaxID=498198 RepID=A0ABY1MXS6_9ACTN|nr:ABC transporter ATP-binding protein [Dietzia kunjamensis]SMO44289.1 putative ABC transport system ATP-binding protein [Dietzia kunjamensis subsp. schimae]